MPTPTTRSPTCARACARPTALALALLWCSSTAAAQGLLFEAFGTLPSDYLGGRCAGGGDADGDGWPDIAFSAPGDDVGGPEAGAVFVHSVRTGTQLFVARGGPGDRLGADIAWAGDLDGDGHDDLFVGAHRAVTGSGDSGFARAISGRDGSALYTVPGVAAGDLFGVSVGALADLDGDGVRELLVGAPQQDTGAVDAGAVHLLSGADGHALDVVHGVEAGELLGWSVAGAGDVDGDGLDDWIAGAPASDLPGTNGGRMLVVSGADGSVLHARVGDGPWGAYGYDVNAAGDVDGDGKGDVIVGARYDAGNGPGAGMVRVLAGSDAHVLHELRGDPGDEFGISVDGLGDVDGDGVPDFGVGAWADDDAGHDSGSISVWSGATGALLWRATGDVATDEMGWCVARAGDVNGDGRADVLGGMPGADAPGVATGGVRLYSGTCGSIGAYGSGSPGAGGLVPTLELTGCPTPGAELLLELGDAPGGAFALVVLGPVPGALPLKGATLLVEPPFSQVPLVLPGVGPAAGALALDVPLPYGTSGLSVALQMLVADPGAPLGVSASDARLLIVE